MPNNNTELNQYKQQLSSWANTILEVSERNSYTPTKEAYTKQLQSDGTSRIVTYRAVQPEESKPEQAQQYVDIQTLNAMLGQLKAEILQGVGGGLSEIKQMIVPPEPQTPKRQRGGSQND